MPSPFPGMDPYIENPARWPDFHSRFISALGDDLGDRLAPDYLVRLDERVYVTDEGAEPEQQSILPDVSVLRPHPSSRPEAADASAVAVDDPPVVPFVVPALLREEHREVLLLIKLRDTMEVVTVVELLSPTNKRPNSVGRREYLEKRQQILYSTTNLVEIDLLRAGARVPLAASVPKSDYYALIYPVPRRPLCEGHPFMVRDPLPEIALPLRGRERVHVALQPLLTQCYDRARYAIEFDYSVPPVPPLAGADAEWAAGLVSK